MTRRSVVAVLAGLVVVTALAAGSRVPWTVHPEDDGLVRLSWRLRPAAAAPCRPLTQEEIEALPVHMRNPDACRREGVAYRLRVWIDAAPVLDRVVRPRGARGDRPVYVFEEFAVAPGAVDVRIAFAPVDPGDAAGPGGPAPADPPGPEDPDAGPVGGAPPANPDFSAGFTFERSLTVPPRGVVLVTLGTDPAGNARVETRTTPPG